MRKTKQIQEIYLIRAFAMIAVVMIHATSSAAVHLGTSSSFNGLYQFLNVFSTFAVPVFIFLSGFVLFLNYYPKPITFQSTVTFYKKRIIYIILPYLIFSVFYFALNAYLVPPTDATTAIKTFIKQFLTGGTYYHLYFMFIIAQFYLLFPLLLLLLKVRGVARYSLLIGLAVQVGLIFFGKEIFDFLHVQNRSAFFLSYFSFFMLGAYLGIFYEKAEKWLNMTTYSLFSIKGLLTLITWICWIGSGTYYVYIMYLGRTYNEWAHSIYYNALWPLFSLFSCVVLFQLAFWFFKRGSSRLVNTLIHIGISSFGIYLIHPFLLFVYNRYTETGNSLMFHIKTMGGFFIVFLLAWGITGLIMKYFKWSAYLFGAGPKVPPYKRDEEKY